MDVPRGGWDIAKGAATDWVPWGSGSKARAKVLGSADGFFFAVVEASPGYSGDPHVHDHPEFLYVLDGAVRTQGQTLERGDGYAADTYTSRAVPGRYPGHGSAPSSSTRVQPMTRTLIP